MTKDLNWETGHNLDAFNDLLRGGFGVHEYEESIKLIWANYTRSKELLGQSQIDKLVEIITDHKHIEFKITD